MMMRWLDEKATNVEASTGVLSTQYSVLSAQCSVLLSEITIGIPTSKSNGPLNERTYLPKLSATC